MAFVPLRVQASGEGSWKEEESTLRLSPRALCHLPAGGSVVRGTPERWCCREKQLAFSLGYHIKGKSRV